MKKMSTATKRYSRKITTSLVFFQYFTAVGLTWRTEPMCARDQLGMLGITEYMPV